MENSYYNAKDLKKFANISDWNEELGSKFFDYYNSVFAEGKLTGREKSLIALAVAHTIQCPYCIDAYNIAAITGMDKRINTIMQTCFFSISGVLPGDVAIKAIKDAVEKTYGRKGKRLVELNFKAIDETLANLFELNIRYG